MITGHAALENPSGAITNFGFLSDGTLTEPDENAYLVFDSNPGGPEADFDYGRHFVFQGHENSGNLAYITRVNLDVTGKNVTNCAIPCYFAACGLAGPVDPPGTYKPCARARVASASPSATVSWR